MVITVSNQTHVYVTVDHYGHPYDYRVVFFSHDPDHFRIGVKSRVSGSWRNDSYTRWIRESIDDLRDRAIAAARLELSNSRITPGDVIDLSP